VTLQGKTAVITGGTRGVGEAIAREFAEHGAHVVVAARTPPEKPVHEAEFRKVDVRDVESVDALVDGVVADRGRLDVLVANAGVKRDGKVARLSPEEWREVMRTNVDGTFHCVRSAARVMRAQGGGRIITLSSSVASRPSVGTGAYGAAKAAVEALTRVAAAELGRYGVLVNCLAPGVVDRGMGVDIMAAEQVWSVYRERCALGRAGEGGEVSAAAVFLASAASSFVNGHVLEVHGGLSWT
jgi:3-oxoacyl-[acyl-carrier protein] reductase